MFPTLPSDPFFYLVAALAVTLTGISKGGFGGIALLAVPLLSLVVPPFEAAALMLPLLLLTDAFGLFGWRSGASSPHLKILLPGALAGIMIGAFSASHVSADAARLLVGLTALGFCLYRWSQSATVRKNTSHPTKMGAFWGALAGFTSYIAHAGSPPLHIYLLPKGLSKAAFAATGVWFFALVNAGKLPAYIATGQLDMRTFTSALVFAPLVPAGFYTGVWLNKRIPHLLFYRLIYSAVFLTGIKLVYDGLT